MKKLKIKPWGNKIQLDFPTTKAGALDVTVGSSIQEKGVVIALGPMVCTAYDDEDKKQKGFKPIIKVGDELLIKTWDVDTLTIENEAYYFISDDSRAICAIIEK